MDEIIQRYNHSKFDDSLKVSEELEILWQTSRKTIDYKTNYWNKYVAYEHTPIAISLNNLRCGLVEKYCSSIIDVGIGCGEFIKKLRIPALGYDINPIAIKWLKTRRLYCDLYKNFPKADGITLWDVLEHIPEPKHLLDTIPLNCFVFVSIPIVLNFKNIYKFKHFRPMEHLTYFTTKGIINYFNILGFSLLEMNNNETLSGREDIETFVFKKAISFEDKLNLEDLSNIRRQQGIYSIKNKINNKAYVGSAIYNNNGNRITRSLSIRIQDNLRKLRNNNHHNIHLQNAWNKYGADNFEFYILEIFIGSNTDLLKREQCWLKELNATDPKFGYNICPVAGNTSGRPVSIETRKKLGEISKGRKHSIETKQKMSKWQIGKKLSDTTKKKISESEKDKIITPELKQRWSQTKKGKLKTEDYKIKMMTSAHTRKLTVSDVKEIRQLLNGGVSIKEIADEFKVTKGNISSIKNGRTWKYI